jgi:predicted phage replisome organizer
MNESKGNSHNYFYLKLKDNFFDNDDMVLLEAMENGYLYSNILLKLYLKSLKDQGKLMYKDRIPYNVSMLAKLTRHNKDIVEKAIDVFIEMGIIEKLDNGAIFMLDIQNYIGKSTTEADRKRKYREKIDAEKSKLLLSGQMSDKCPTHIEIEKEIDIEIDIEQELDNNIENVVVDNLFTYYEKAMGRTLSSFEYEELNNWEDTELTRYAIKKAVENGKFNMGYIKGILRQYNQNNIKTLAEAQAKDEEYRSKPINKNYNDKGRNILDKIIEGDEKE